MTLREAISDGVILIGMALSVFGAWLVYEPAGLIVGGLAFTALGYTISIGGET